MTKNIDIINAAVELIIKAAILAARFSGRVRNYDCFDDQRYGKVGDVGILVHDVSFMLLQGIQKANLRRKL